MYVYENYGRIERGQVISKYDDIAKGAILYRVQSLDRDGIIIPEMRSVDDRTYELEEKVYYFSFPDGTGRILCSM